MSRYIVKTSGGRPHMGSRPSTAKGSISFGPIETEAEQKMPPWWFVH